MTSYLLDTDHLTLVQRNHPNVIHRFNVSNPQNLFVSVVTIEEQIRGRLAIISRFSNQSQQWTSTYAAFLKTVQDTQRFNVLELDSTAVQIFQNSRKQGIRIGSQDLKIASIALSKGCTLATRNYRDFKQIPELILEDWSMIS